MIEKSWKAEKETEMKFKDYIYIMLPYPCLQDLFQVDCYLFWGHAAVEKRIMVTNLLYRIFFQ